MVMGMTDTGTCRNHIIGIQKCNTTTDACGGIHTITITTTTIQMTRIGRRIVVVVVRIATPIHSAVPKEKQLWESVMSNKQQLCWVDRSLVSCLFCNEYTVEMAKDWLND